MVGVFVLVFALHLAAALLAEKPPKDGERYLTMAAFVLLIPALLSTSKLKLHVNVCSSVVASSSWSFKILACQLFR